MQSIIPYLQLIRADKPIGTVLLACPMLWALWLASDGNPNPKYVLIFLVGAFMMRSAGCVINDFADRKIDNQVKRTKDRPLTAGKITSQHAILFFAILILFAFVLLLMLPTLTVIPAIFAVGLTILYPFTKRFLSIPQLILGAAFSTSILMAFMAEQGSMGLIAWLLFIASTIWTVIYDNFYAMVDRDDDIHLGIQSSALLFGKNDLFISKILMLLFLILMIIIGYFSQLTAYYYLGLFLASLCFIYQIIITKNRDRTGCFTAFLNNQWVGILIFIGLLLNYL